MGKKESATAAKRRRRMESTTSSTSNQTQITQMSFDSTDTQDTSSTVVNGTNSQNDVRQKAAQTARKRTLSENPAERPRSFDWDRDENRQPVFFQVDSTTPSPTGQNHVPVCYNQPRRGRRNTDTSVNTQPIQKCQSFHEDEFHRCKTTSCIQDHSMLRYPQSPTSPGDCCQQYGHQNAYDNAGVPWNPAPLSQANRSRSASTVEHHYISLDPPLNNYIIPVAGNQRPVDTTVVLQNNGRSQVVHRQSCENLDSIESGTPPRSDQSSGYCTNANIIGRHVCGCFQVNHVEFYKNGFYVLLVVNVLVLLLCLVGLPMVYFFSVQQDPPPPPPIVIHSTKETCRPATELTGKIEKKTSTETIIWKLRDNRKDCGFTLLPNNQSIEINETRKYFIYSRVLFRIEKQDSRSTFFVGHKILVNGDMKDNVSQKCSAGPEIMLHMSVLETTERLTKGDRISIQVTAEQSQHVEGYGHKLGIIAL